MRKERKTFPPAQPCSGSPPRARCVVDRGCGAALGPGLDGPVSPVSALRRCSPWLLLNPGGLQHHCPGFLGSPSVAFLLMFLEPGTSPHESPLLSPHLL